MRKMKRMLALLCVFALCFSLVACNDEKPVDSSASTAPSAQPSVTVPQGGNTQKINYIVTLKSAGGLPLSGVTVLAYKDAALTELQGYGQTDANGQAVLSMPAATEYYLDVTDAPEGYLTEESYKLSGAATEIVLTSAVIADTNVSGVTYKLGSVMHDIVFTDTAGTTWKLSDVLKEKDMVLLNFWYTTCSWCVTEFPYMQAAYENYSDSIEIFALDPAGESMSDITAFQNSMGLTFPMGDDTDSALFGAFNGTGCPTSVVIDRYGVVCLIEVGALTTEDAFHYVFDAFVGDSYSQKLYDSAEDITPVIKPNVEMPAPEDIAAVLNSGDIAAEYFAEPDEEAAEMTWPFVIAQKDGVDCIAPSNAGVAGSFATIYANVTMKAGQALALDYFASSEYNADTLYVLVDRNDIYQISGTTQTQWKTCYPWVATEDGVYEIALCFLKDGSVDEGDDTVYIGNLRLMDAGDVDVASYIPRFAATHMNEDGFGYQSYITPVFNENDGYYHVDSADGPLLFANLMMPTRFSNTEIFTLAANGLIVVDGVDYYEQLVDYCSYASNSQVYSMCPVNEELKQLLQKVTEAVGIEQTENEWLQICEYYDAYGTGGVQMSNPIIGLSADAAFTAQLGTNTVTYDRMLMPRGLLYRFVPTKSGAYRITSDSEFEVEGWIFTRKDLEERMPFYTYEANERLYYSETDISMVVYLEEGKEYFIDIAYYDVYMTGSFTFDIVYAGKELELFVSCAPGPFTYEDENTYEIVTGGIDVALGSDGYYHELLANGSLGSVVYADFAYPTTLFTSNSIEDLLEAGAFNFAVTEDDQDILDYYAYYEALDFNGTDFETCMQELWGEDFDYYWDYYKVDDVLDGIYHGKGEDLSPVIRKYLKEMETSGDKEGCVAVTEELALVLQALVDKYSFKDVENGWIKLCYYYDYFGPDANK